MPAAAARWASADPVHRSTNSARAPGAPPRHSRRSSPEFQMAMIDFVGPGGYAAATLGPGGYAPTIVALGPGGKALTASAVGPGGKSLAAWATGVRRRHVRLRRGGWRGEKGILAGGFRRGNGGAVGSPSGGGRR